VALYLLKVLFRACAAAHPMPHPDLEARFYPLTTRLAILGLTLLQLFIMYFLVRWFFRFWTSLAAGSVVGVRTHQPLLVTLVFLLGTPLTLGWAILQWYWFTSI
jgi:hypothetical protein